MLSEIEYRRGEAEAWLSMLEITVELRDLAEIEASALAHHQLAYLPPHKLRCAAIATIRHTLTPYAALCDEAPSGVAKSLLHQVVNAAIVEAYPELLPGSSSQVIG